MMLITSMLGAKVSITIFAFPTSMGSAVVDMLIITVTSVEVSVTLGAVIHGEVVFGNWS